MLCDITLYPVYMQKSQPTGDTSSKFTEGKHLFYMIYYMLFWNLKQIKVALTNAQVIYLIEDNPQQADSMS